MAFDRIKHYMRLALSQTVLLLLVFLNLMTLPPPFESEVRPFLVLMAVYYWAIYRPTLVPPALCFVIGLFMDILSGLPMGLNALCYVAVQWVVRDQRRFLMGQPYTMIWAGFGMVTVMTALLQWGFFSLIHVDASPVLPVAASVLLSLILFPPVSLLLVWVHRQLPVASRGFP